MSRWNDKVLQPWNFALFSSSVTVCVCCGFVARIFIAAFLYPFLYLISALAEHTLTRSHISNDRFSSFCQ